MGFVDGISKTLSSIATGLGITTPKFFKGMVSDDDCYTSHFNATDEPEGCAENVQLYLPDRYRGHLHNNADECITCNLCARACPIDCFIIEGEKMAGHTLPISQKNRTQRPAIFDIDLGKCIYCGFCTIVCPTESLTMTKGFTGATDKYWDRKVDKSEDVPEGAWKEKDSTQTYRTARGNGMFVHYGFGYMSEEERKAEDELIAEKDATRKREAAEKSAKKKEAAEAAKKTAAEKEAALKAAGASTDVEEKKPEPDNAAAAEDDRNNTNDDTIDMDDTVDL